MSIVDEVMISVDIGNNGHCGRSDDSSGHK